jgi:hypothetical protein
MKASVWVSHLRARDLNPRPTDNEPVFTHPAAKFSLMMMMMMMSKVLCRRVGYVISVNGL